MRDRLSKCLVVIITAAIAGCDGKSQPATYPVTGTVTFQDGTPLKGVTIRFRTTDRVPAITGSGKTDASGNFSLSAAGGENTALIAPTIPRDLDSMTPAQRDRVMNPIDATFLEYETSNLKFQVTDDPTNNQFEIKVRPPRR
jgi:hypothetical protein